MSDKALILRTCNAEMKSHGGFQWPESGPVSCNDWSPEPCCGKGLHGFLWGEGDSSLANWNHDAKWLVVAVDADSIVDLGGMVKFPCGEVLFAGDRKGATELLVSRLTKSASVIGAYITGGHDSTLTGGYYSTLTGVYDSTLTGGDYSTLTGGSRSTLTGGYYSTLTGGDYSTLTGGDYSTLTGGYDSTLTGGDYSTLTGGSRSTLTGGDYSTLTGGDYSTLTGGGRSTLTGGSRSTLTGGYDSTLILKFYDFDKHRYRVVTLEVGENGIEPNKPYKLDANNRPVMAEPLGKECK